jgi:hypothetical protein
MPGREADIAAQTEPVSKKVEAPQKSANERHWPG